MTSTTTTEHAAKLRALGASVFGRLSPRQLDDVARLSELRHVGAGDVICAEGEFGQAAFVIAAGQVKVVAGGIEVARFGPPDLVGDWALFTSGYRSATLRAVTDVEVVEVDPRELDSLLMAVPVQAIEVGPRRPTESTNTKG